MRKSNLFHRIAVAVLASGWAATTGHAGPISFGTGANQFTMDFVPIGNAGNAADTTGTPTPAQTGGVGVGAVSYAYQIGKYEVSEDMISKANAEGGLLITKDTRGANKPATSVSWNEAARFVNWLNTSQGYQAAYKFAVQPGGGGYSANANIALWTISDPGYNAANAFRNSNAHYWLPNFDEWYKAAYYDPNKSGGAGYWNYPTGSDATPTAVASGTTAGTAVYDGQVGPADIMLAGGLSRYGTMGQGGNVYEWQETEGDLVNDFIGASARGLRGGGWYNDASNQLASVRGGGVESFSLDGTGFRVASVPVAVPEPSSIFMAVTGLGGLLLWRLRRKGR